MRKANMTAEDITPNISNYGNVLKRVINLQIDYRVQTFDDNRTEIARLKELWSDT